MGKNFLKNVSPFSTSQWVITFHMLLETKMQTHFHACKFKLNESFLFLLMPLWSFCRRNHWGTSGITSTWAGRTTGFPTTPVAFSGSWKKSTAHKVPFQTLALLWSTAGTKQPETVCYDDAVMKQQEHFSLIPQRGHWGALSQTVKTTFHPVTIHLFSILIHQHFFFSIAEAYI